MEIKKQKEILDQICPLEKGYTSSKRYLRMKFFSEIKTEVQAYLLGFYLADGNLNLKRNTLRVKITKSDIEIIKLFAEYISPNARQTINKPFVMRGPDGKDIHVKSSAQIDITGKQIAIDLDNLGYGERKTYKELCLPNLPEELMWAFIRGYFDGDGCITGGIRYPNPKNRERNIAFRACANWTAKTSNLFIQLKPFFEKYGIECGICYVKSDKTYRLSISARRSLKILYDNMYKNFNFCLKRKQKKFKHYVNTEISQLIAEHCNA